jgi:signal peptidase I
MEEKTEILRIFKSFLRFIYEFIKTIAFILLVFFLLRYFLIQPFIVDGNSMEPNFHDKEYLLVDKISYKFKEPKRGDTVIFQPPNISVFFIKRIIGLPGEKVVIENGKVFIYNKQNPSGVLLSEPYLSPNGKTEGDTFTILQEGQYYLLGDNRENSSDSRDFGPLPKQKIVGRVFITVFPISEFGLVNRINYPDLSSLILKPLSLLHQLPDQI